MHGFYYFDEIETLGYCTYISMKFLNMDFENNYREKVCI